ncbi:TlpA family protein disulfide reductase [Hymenobacter negativus]|uniref:TlpA family protein disulfide reductase n=1 Tax=Hymenobacter negativus TaxID=2795026 RepID=A0ABS0Q308_9BACT|nr:TlpA disulfide reductase family protein [Hymenobacter negativus]MBH8556661.1 TlpA family protein disulfide reductase [Hymenobacter negativus]
MKHFLLVLLLLVSSPAFSQDLAVGQPMPAFTVSNEQETIKSLNLKGKVVLINFFATWCGPCMQELPQMQQFWTAHKSNKNLVVLVIGREHSQSEITAFKAKKGFDLPMYPDEKRTVYSLFATQYIPRNYLVDAQGNIAYTSVGFEQQEFNRMTSKVEELLKRAQR